MKVLLFFILIPFATTAVLHFPLFRSNSKKNKSFVWSSEEVHNRGYTDLYNGHYSNKAGVGSQIINYADLEYATRVTIGYPPQEFTVALTLSAPIMWVPHPGCEGIVCQKRRKFDLHKSQSFITFPNRTESFRCSAGTAKVLLGNDYVSLGGLNETAQVIPRMTFGLATTLKPLLYKDPFDGVFGLAFSNDLMPDIRPAIQQAYERKVIDKVMFTVWLPSSRLTQSGAGGAITFGDVDDVNCGPILGYAKMTDNSFYMFEVRGVSMGIYAYQEKSKVASELIGWIEGPRSVIENMAKIAGAKFDDDDGIYKIACNATPPPIVFLIGDSSYSIDYTNYIVQLETGECMFALMPTANIYWVMGLPFIRSYCHVYDIDNKRIGFATPRPAIIPTTSPTTTTRNPRKKGSAPPNTSFAMFVLVLVYMLL